MNPTKREYSTARLLRDHLNKEFDGWFFHVNPVIRGSKCLYHLGIYTGSTDHVPHDYGELTEDGMWGLLDGIEMHKKYMER